MQQPIPTPNPAPKQARKARRQAFWGCLWHELVKMEFITNVGDWLEEFLARVVEKLALFSAIYLIVEVGVPAISFQSIHETAMGIILASPELIMVGAFKMATREIKAGKQQAWGLMLCVFLLLILTTLTVLELMVWHWSQDNVNKLLAIRFLASIAYTFCHGILKESRYEREQQPAPVPAFDVQQALADLAVRLDTELSSIQTQIKQQVDSLFVQLDTLSTRHQSSDHHLSNHLSTVDQSLDTLTTDLSRLVQQVREVDTQLQQVDSLDTRLAGVEECQSEHLSQLEESIRAMLREIQKTGRYPVSRQDKESSQQQTRSQVSRQMCPVNRQLDTRRLDGLDSQKQEACLDTRSKVDTLSSSDNPTGKIIRLSRHGKSATRQPVMTERVLEFIRANRREPSLGEIQSWGCAKQTAVNSREAARGILRREIPPSSQENRTLEPEGTNQ